MKSDSERAGKTRKTQRTEVPRAIRELVSSIEALREAEIIKSRTMGDFCEKKVIFRS